MVVTNRYKEADLKKKNVTELRILVREAGIHGLRVAGAHKGKLIAALMTGALPPNEEDGMGPEYYDKFAVAFAPLLDLIAEMVIARLKRERNRTTPSKLRT